MKKKNINKEFKKLEELLWNYRQCSNEVEEYGREAISKQILKIINMSLKQRDEKTYLDGYLDGFYSSGEGYNGEYVHPNLRPNKVLLKHLKEKALQALKDK
jgi:hypothetical protein